MLLRCVAVYLNNILLQFTGGGVVGSKQLHGQLNLAQKTKTLLFSTCMCASGGAMCGDSSSEYITFVSLLSGGSFVLNVCYRSCDVQELKAVAPQLKTNTTEAALTEAQSDLGDPPQPEETAEASAPEAAEDMDTSAQLPHFPQHHGHLGHS